MHSFYTLPDYSYITMHCTSALASPKLNSPIAKPNIKTYPKNKPEIFPKNARTLPQNSPLPSQKQPAFLPLSKQLPSPNFRFLLQTALFPLLKRPLTPLKKQPAFHPFYSNFPKPNSRFSIRQLSRYGVLNQRQTV